MKYIVLLSNSDRKVEAIGTAEGKPLGEAAAKQLARQYQKAYPGLDVITLPINALSLQNLPLCHE